MHTHDRVKGVLLGLAAGDRNGGPIRMALQLTESLILLQRFDAGDILQRYLAWWQAGGFDTGPIAAQVFTLIGNGTEPAAAVAQVHAASGGYTAGCNPAHRSAVLAMAAFLPDQQLADCAYNEAALTHYDRLAGDVAAATVRLCQALINGMPWPAALEYGAADRVPQTIAALQEYVTPPQDRGGFAPHVLKAAVYFVHRSQEPAEALSTALAFAGPSNYCPVLVGAISGARWGAHQIEARALAHCTILSPVEQAAESLAEAWGEH